jgi:molybdopterin-guanine dinucleotide biosynthesis protein A
MWQQDFPRGTMTEAGFDNITGIILVGGKSRRMGTDKAFLEVGGIPLFERVLEVVRGNLAQVMLVGDRPERFAGYRLPVLPDIFPGSALGGLYTGLYHARTDFVFACSCDLPFPNPEILRHLCRAGAGYDAVVPVTAQGYEPFFALYSRRCLQPIGELLEKGNFCAYSYFPTVRVNYVREPVLQGLDPSGTCFINLNTPEEFQRVSGDRYR